MSNYYIIPDNYSGDHSFRGIPYRNLIEAGVLAFINWKLLGLLPFVFTIRIVIQLIAVLVSLFIGCIGIRDESLTQYFISYILFRRAKRLIHMRPIGFITDKERELINKEKKKGNRHV